MNALSTETSFGPIPRRATVGVRVGEGQSAVMVGGGAPIVVQSMTNTDTADVAATASQVEALARAGSELVRITVDRDEAAAAVPHIRDRVRAKGVAAPLIGDFHYIGHKLLSDHPACAEALDKYRINPGNVGFKNKRDLQFGKIVETAIRSCTAETFADRMMRERESPISSARLAERSAERAIASRVTAPASSGAAERAFSSMRSVKSSWSSEPQLAPMRTALLFLIAISTIFPN